MSMTGSVTLKMGESPKDAGMVPSKRLLLRSRCTTVELPLLASASANGVRSPLSVLPEVDM